MNALVIEYALSAGATISIDVFSPSGTLVLHGEKGYRSPGSHSERITLKRGTAAGMYLEMISAGDERYVTKVLMAK